MDPPVTYRSARAELALLMCLLPSRLRKPWLVHRRLYGLGLDNKLPSVIVKVDVLIMRTERVRHVR